MVDDGSPDKSGEICERWAARDGRFKVVHQQNGGLSAARNTGIGMAKGQLLTFVDSDDYLAEGTLKPLVERMMHDEGISIIEYNAVKHAVGGGEASLGIADMEWQNVDDYWFRGHAYAHTYAWNKIYRREVFNGVLFPVGRNFEDVHTLPLLLQNVKGRVVTTSQGTYHYVENPNGITHNSSAADHESLLDAHINYLEAHREQMRHQPLPFVAEYYAHVLNIQITATSRYKVPVRLKRMDSYAGRWGIMSGNIPLLTRLKMLLARMFFES
jgi:glycosyltransferase involved in cell wall biosynthesis